MRLGMMTAETFAMKTKFVGKVMDANKCNCSRDDSMPMKAMSTVMVMMVVRQGGSSHVV